MHQPPGFENTNKPNHVFKLAKALYGLKQAHCAWYKRLNTLLIKNIFSIGKINTSLFRKDVKTNFLIVQIYVEDIIFGSTNAKR